LSSLQTSSEIYKALGGLFQLADQRYNSGLFHFKEEKGRFDAPETFTLDLTIGNDPLRYILKRLYYPDSPYAFRVIPVEILGQVYEQFLGQVIRLDTSRQVLIEAKPEVRKAGGVYYTPTYIVNYIVQHTVRTLVEGKTPKQVSDFRILDPACGSGSFLLGAYSFLLEWHLHWYLANGSAKHKNKEIMQVDTETWRLTTKERKRILLNNIYGVDIDTQAVEVTKLSLLLKVLEGETEQGAAYQIGFDRLLPDLGTNIKCGNSLIGPDFYNNNQASFLDEEERYRVNVFDWQAEFPQIMQVGGFDAVIGNPPYIFSRNQGISTLDKNYFYSHYSYQSDQLNTFSIFVERCYGILHSFGVLGFITPNNWLTISSFSPLREFILKTTDDITVINILDKVFASANVDTAIILFRKGLSRPSKLNIGEMKDVGKVTLQSVLLSDIKEPNYIIQISLLKNTKDRKVLNKITSSSKPLSDFSTVSTGLKAYQVGKGKPTQTDKEKKDRIFHSTNRVNNTYERYLDGVDVRRYCLVWSGQYLSYGNWLAEPRRSVPFTNERILVRQIPSKPPYLVNAVFTKEKFYNDINSMVIFDPSEDISLKYLLGIINSKLLSMWFLRTFDKLQRKVFPQFKVGELSSFPIRIINFNDNEDLYYYNQIITRIDTMLYLNEFILSAKTPMDKRFIARQIETTDKQIDQLVYDLYGLTAEERDLVEAATQ